MTIDLDPAISRDVVNMKIRRIRSLKQNTIRTLYLHDGCKTVKCWEMNRIIFYTITSALKLSNQLLRNRFRSGEYREKCVKINLGNSDGCFFFLVRNN